MSSNSIDWCFGMAKFHPCMDAYLDKMFEHVFI
jgi:hypothetical protein